MSNDIEKPKERKKRLSDFVVVPNNRIEEQFKKIEQGYQSISSTGFYNMDKFIMGSGGFRQGEITIITGNTACGKTQLFQNIILNCASKGIQTFLASLEFTVDKVLMNLSWQIVGKDLSKYDAFTIEYLTKAHNWIQDHQIYIYSKSMLESSSIDSMIEAMEFIAEKRKVRMFFIDPLTAFVKNHQSPVEDLDPAIRKLKDFAERYNAHVLVVMHARKTEDHKIVGKDDLYGSNVLNIYTHNILSLWRYADDINGRANTNFSNKYKEGTFLYCLKNREFGELIGKKIAMMFDPIGRRFSEAEISQDMNAKLTLTRKTEPVYLTSDLFNKGYTNIRHKPKRGEQ